MSFFTISLAAFDQNVTVKNRNLPPRFHKKPQQKHTSAATKKKYLSLTYRSRLTLLQQDSHDSIPTNRGAPEQHLKHRDEQSMKE
jgi:hypothetical protein